MEQFQLLLKSAVFGVRDSIWGFVKFLQITKDYWLKNQQKKTSSTSQSSRKKKFEDNEESHEFVKFVKCFMLNGVVFWLSIVLFNEVIVPCVQTAVHYTIESGPVANFIWGWLSPVLSLVFGIFWEVPMYTISKLINCLWFQDIAEMAFRRGGGRRTQSTSISKFLADFLFSSVVQTFYIAQAMLCKQYLMAPFGDIVHLFLMSCLYSLYAFEYKWYIMGWELHKRLSFIESNWPYFIAFGLPMGIIITLPSSYFVSCAMFSILFPLQILAANDAEPVTGVCGFSIRSFSIVVWISNHLFQRTINLKRPTTNTPHRAAPSLRTHRS